LRYSTHLAVLPNTTITMAVLTYVAGFLAFVSALLYSYIRIPSSLPKGIPSVPIYVSLLGLWSDMGQDEIYDRWLRVKLEKFGAVKIWFAGRWNILVTRPDLVSYMFRNEDIYAKAGSQKKIPWSVIAALVGDNIINSHGEDWKHYTHIMKPGMQKTNFDSKPILDKSRRFVDLLLRTQDGNRKQGVLVNPLIQRFAIAAMGESFLDIDFGVSPIEISRLRVGTYII
jgi:unspecific monooxygenase